MDQQKRLAAQRRKIFKRLDFFAAPGGERRLVCRKNGTSEPSAAASSCSFSGCKRRAEKFVQREERRRGVAAAAAESGGERDFFLQMDFHAVGNFRPPAEMPLRRGERDFWNPPADSGRCRSVGCRFRRARKASSSQKLHRLHDGFEFVKSVGALAEDVQQQVDLAGRFFFEASWDKKKAPTRNVGALIENSKCSVRRTR